MKKKTLAVALTLVLALPALATPEKDNPNQDFSGTPVTIETTDSEVKISITNVEDRGLPDVSIWANDVLVASYAEIGKGKTVTHVIDVDTSLVGAQTFDIVVWTRLGNANFQDILFADTAVVDVKGSVCFYANGGVFSSGSEYTDCDAYGWNEEIVFPEAPVREGYIFVGWATQGDNALLLPGITYAELVGGDNTVTSESIWAQWEEEVTTKTPEEWVADITTAINAAIGSGPIQNIVVPYNGGTAIILTIDGQEYVFTSNGSVNSDKSLVLDGGRYIINIRGNGTFAIIIG